MITKAQKRALRKSDLIKALDKKGFIPIRYKTSKQPTFGLWDISKGYLSETDQTKENFKFTIGNILDSVVNNNDFNQLATFCVSVHDVTKNPFISTSFYSDSEYYKNLRLNDIRFSRYKRELKDILGDSDVNLILKSIRANDENKIMGFPFTEIIVAHNIFAPNKIMAIPCLFSEDRGIGKTTVFTLGNYLYDKVESPFHVNVNVADTKGLGWGDDNVNTRSKNFDDMPNEMTTMKQIEREVKSSSTNAGDIEANKKGSAKVRTNAFNITMTTNSLYAIPLDGDDDRRIYPVNLHLHDFTNEDIERIKALDIPMSGARDKYYPIMQKLLNHFCHVFLRTKDNRDIKEFLNVRVPNSEFKREVARRKASINKRFELILKQSETIYKAIEDLNIAYPTDNSDKDSNPFNFLNSTQHAMIKKTSNQYYLYLLADGLKALNSAIGLDSSLSASKIAVELFKGKDYKTWNVGKYPNGKPISKKSVRLPLARNFKPYTVEIEKL